MPKSHIVCCLAIHGQTPRYRRIPTCDGRCAHRLLQFQVLMMTFLWRHPHGENEWGTAVDGEAILHQLIPVDGSHHFFLSFNIFNHPFGELIDGIYQYLLGYNIFQPSVWWCRISHPSTVASVVGDSSKTKALQRIFMNFLYTWDLAACKHHTSQLGLAAKRHKSSKSVLDSQCWLTHMQTAPNLLLQRGSGCAALKIATVVNQEPSNANLLGSRTVMSAPDRWRPWLMKSQMNILLRSTEMVYPNDQQPSGLQLQILWGGIDGQASEACQLQALRVIRQSIHACSCIFWLHWICINCQYPRNTVPRLSIAPQTCSFAHDKSVRSDSSFNIKVSSAIKSASFVYETIQKGSDCKPLPLNDHVSHRILLRISYCISMYQSCSSLFNAIVSFLVHKLLHCWTKTSNSWMFLAAETRTSKAHAANFAWSDGNAARPRVMTLPSRVI